MSKTIDDMIKNFKDTAEFEAFYEAQQQTIVQLSKKIKFLEDEKQNLLQQLAAAPVSNVERDPNAPSIKDEEQICTTQLQLLKMNSNSRELTAEECKKVEIYVKVLNMVRGKDTKMEDEYKKKNVDELLSLVQGGK